MNKGLVVLLALLAIALFVVLIVAVVFLVRLLRMYRLATNPNMPTQAKVAFWGALIYAIFPVDVLPDPIYLDDVGVLVAATAYIANLARKTGLLDREGNPIRRIRLPENPRDQHSDDDQYPHESITQDRPWGGRN